MPLAPGHKLGPYEILSSLGAGGMGEVYKAKDARLDRLVAIKVLPESLASDSDRRQRFEHEAHLLSSLSHPNLLAVFDVGCHDGLYFIVTELLNGSSLRAVLSSHPLALRKSVEYGLQIARGLAAAHEKGIIHRDLKPENIYVTDDGQVKILDFGLAKSVSLDSAYGGKTVTVQTAPGIVLGTVGYMSPEQVRGQPAEARSDIFAFGAVIYEMLAGKSAFQRNTSADTMSAILKEDAPDLSTSGKVVPSGLESIIHHCLEKNPQRRFQSAQDLAFNLEQFAHPSASGHAPTVSTDSHSQLTLWRLLLASAVALAVAAAFFVGRRFAHPPAPSFQQITFQRGRLLEARFSPDGQTIVYSAEWNGQPSDVYIARSDRPGSRSLDLTGAKLLSVSRGGDLAVQLNPRTAGTFVETGTLAIVPLSGGSPREVATDVQYADFSPDGSQLAIVRDLGSRARLEYPVGKSLLETTASLTDPRVSPGGDKIAILQRAGFDDDLGFVAVVDASGHEKLLTKQKYEVMDLAWSPRGDEIWFTVSDRGAHRSIHAVSLDSRERVLLEVPGSVILKDVFSDGRALLVRDNARRELNGLIAGDPRERDLSWLDWTHPDDISPDGSFFVFHEAGVGGGENLSVFMRKLDGSPPVLLGEGNGLSISPDRKFVLTSSEHGPFNLFLVPLGPGQTRQLTNDSIDYRDGLFLPNGKQVLFFGNEPGHSPRWYLQNLEGGGPKPITSELYGDANTSISPDAKFFVVGCPDGKPCLYPFDGGAAQAIPGIDVRDAIIQWSDDGHAIYVFKYGSLPARIERLDVSTGKRTLWKTVAPADPAGVHGITLIRMTRDGRVCLYSYLRTFSELFLVKNLD
jgi:serine/threonine protein kinase/Tol biopolymer transport system component